VFVPVTHYYAENALSQDHGFDVLLPLCGWNQSIFYLTAASDLGKHIQNQKQSGHSFSGKRKRQ